MAFSRPDWPAMDLSEGHAEFDPEVTWRHQDRAGAVAVATRLHEAQDQGVGTRWQPGSGDEEPPAARVDVQRPEEDGLAVRKGIDEQVDAGSFACRRLIDAAG